MDDSATLGLESRKMTGRHVLAATDERIMVPKGECKFDPILAKLLLVDQPLLTKLPHHLKSAEIHEQ